MKGKKEMEGCKRASGGAVKPYDAQGSNVEKEAEERKHGGKVKRKHGGKVEHHGKVEHEHHGKVHHEHVVEGHKPKHRLDRPHRAKGGRVGSDKSPLSSSSHEDAARDHKTDSGGMMD